MHYLNIDKPNILLTAIGLNKFAYINYSFCWRVMNNSVVKVLVALPLMCVIFFQALCSRKLFDNGEYPVYYY